MMKIHSTTKLAMALGLCAGLILAPAPVTAQSFSITFQGPTNGLGGIGSGDILVPTAPAPGFGPLPAPTIAVPFWNLGIFPPGPWPQPEVDALSYGTAAPVTRDSAGNWTFAPRFHFSVDSYAAGIPGSPAAPNVLSEGVFAASEASADIFVNLAVPMAPVGPGAGVFGNTSVFDGDGFAPPVGIPGIGLIEPNPPTPGAPDPGDTLDAFSLFNPMWPVYFSLDAAWVDPLDGPPANLGSAPVNGFAPGDVLAANPGGPPWIYAPFAALGLGPNDDLDALSLWDNGDGFFTPPAKPFDWQYNNTDMIFFSVRRGSPIIGALDSFFGAPIMEGDILMPPVFGGATPAIFISSEALGLDTTRTGAPPFMPFSDDLDALGLPPC